MKVNDPSSMGWSQCTAEGSEIAQLRVWAGLPIRAKLEAAEELGSLARRFLDRRKTKGLPYIDPLTGKAVRPAPRIPGT